MLVDENGDQPFVVLVEGVALGLGGGLVPGLQQGLGAGEVVHQFEVVLDLGGGQHVDGPAAELEVGAGLGLVSLGQEHAGKLPVQLSQQLGLDLDPLDGRAQLLADLLGLDDHAPQQRSLEEHRQAQNVRLDPRLPVDRMGVAAGQLLYRNHLHIMNTMLVVEHMEPHLFEWSLLEYLRIIDLLPPGYQLVFTNAASFLDYSGPESVSNQKHVSALKERGHAVFESRSLISILEEEPVRLAGVELSRKEICLLDLRGKRDLEPSDKYVYKAFVFGGVLGCHPPIDRPKQLREAIQQYIRMGDMQLSTDTAVHVAIKILHEGKAFKDL